MKKTVILFMLALCLTVLTSCYDKSEVEETAYLIALGIDLSEDKNENDSADNEYVYTFQFAAPLAAYSESSSGDSNGAVKNIKISATDFYSAKNILVNYLSKNVNMSHLKLIVCSKDFAKTSVKEHIGLFMKEREIRPSTFVAVSEEKAQDFLAAVHPEFESSTSKYYELANSEEMLVFAPFIRLSDFLNSSETFDKSAVLPVGEIVKAENEALNIKPAQKNATELSKMAVFKDFSLKEILSKDDARLYNLLSGKEKKLIFSFMDEKNPENNIAFDVFVLQKPMFKVEDKNGGVKVSVDILTEIKYIGSMLPKGYKSIAEVNSFCKRELEKRIYDFLKMTQETLNADILKVQKFYKMNFLNEEDFKKKEFDKKYKSAEFDVRITSKVNSKDNISNEIN